MSPTNVRICLPARGRSVGMARLRMWSVHVPVSLQDMATCPAIAVPVDCQHVYRHDNLPAIRPPLAAAESAAAASAGCADRQGKNDARRLSPDDQWAGLGRE